jgi:hypothetical protein
VTDDEFNELQKLTLWPDWDLEGGRAVTHFIWCRARGFYASCRKAAGESWVEPHVSACGAGLVHFTWIHKSGRANLEVDESTFWNLSIKYCPDEKYRQYVVNERQSLEYVVSFLNT